MSAIDILLTAGVFASSYDAMVGLVADIIFWWVGISMSHGMREKKNDRCIYIYIYIYDDWDTTIDTRYIISHV